MKWRTGLTALWPALAVGLYLSVLVIAIILLSIKQPWVY